DPADARIVRGGLAARTPVSRRFAVLDHASPFLLNALLHRRLELHLLTDLDVIAVCEHLPGDGFRLGDRVGRTIPPLRAVLGALGASPRVVEIAFPPDRLAWEGEPRVVEHEDVLMVRGPFAPGGPVGIPPTVHF